MLKTFLIIFTILLVTFVHGRQWELTPANSDLHRVLKGITPHDTIVIKQGNYYMNEVVISKPVTIIGQGMPIIDGNSKGEIFIVQSDSVSIANLEIRNVGVSYVKDLAAIQFNKSSYGLVKNVIFTNSFFGVYLAKSSFIKILDNKFLGKAEIEMASGNAIHAWTSKNLTIKNNYVENHRDGIYLEFVDNTLVDNNISKNNLRYGLHFMFSDNNQYLNNTFENNGAGVAVMYSRDTEMSNNIFRDNWGTASYGLLLKEIYDAEVINNNFSGNTVGIFAESATRIKFFENRFENNGWALKILGSCMDNEFLHNDFLNNTFDVSTNTSKNYNVYENNFWSSYSGYDLDKDGIGDVPYKPVKLFSYLVSRIDPSIILLRSTFVSLLDFAEMVTPIFTPATLIDNKPLMSPYYDQD